MNKKMVLLMAAAMLFGVLFAVSGRETVQVFAADKVARVDRIWSDGSGRGPIIEDGELMTDIGYVWAEKQDNGRYYVYFSKERDGKARYLFQTQPNVVPREAIFVNDDVYFVQDSADKLKHYVYRVNLSGTRKQTRLFGFKSKTAAEASLINYRNGRIYYYYGDEKTGSLYSYDVISKTKKGCKGNTLIEDIFQQYIYLREPGTDTIRIYDCSQNKVVRKITTPSEYTYDRLHLQGVGDGFKIAICYKTPSYWEDKTKESARVYLADLSGANMQQYKDYIGEKVTLVDLYEKGVSFSVEETYNGRPLKPFYVFVMPDGKNSAFNTYSELRDWYETYKNEL